MAIDWPGGLDSFGIKPGAYEAFRAAEPTPSLTVEMFERAMDAMLKERPAITVELHPLRCPIWKTGDRRDCRCSPGWIRVPIQT